LDHGGSEFDPLVVKTLVHALGLYPVGCRVRLNTGEVGTVLEPPEHPRFLDRPKVNLQLDAKGDPVEEELVSLMEKDDDGGFKRSILKLYQLDEIELQLEEYLAVI
jgi:hypothetical protein